MIAEKFSEHIVFEKLEQIKNRLQENEVREKIQLEFLSFYDSAIEYISERINSTIPVLVQEAELNALANEIEAGLGQINNFIGNNNQGHLTNANNNLNSALNRARNFPLPVSKSKYNFSKEIANFEKTVSEKYTELAKENKAFEERLTQLKTSIESKQQELNSLNQLLAQKQTEITNLTNTYTTDYNNIKSTANQQFEQEKAKFRQEFNTEKQSFVTEKDALQKEFNTEREALKKELTTERETYKKQIDTLRENISTETEDLVKELEIKLAESKKLVNIIGNVGATGNYQIIADYHKGQANLWRWIALFFMVLLTGLLIYTIYHVTGTSFNWQVTIVRIVAFSVLLYPATYAARESSKHRRLENLNRKSELDIASINPFIEILPEEKKQAIKERMVEKFFGNSKDLETEDKKDNSEELTVSGFERLIKALIPFLKK